ncbi:hypothetical protein H257_15715 [Aphanomyces astaci]|uniref:RING-type E3 ubiquitin transferase n=1 Tax=Aphanomyces astaci TaxID=112090 RepID=W4FMW6_APHAT|nr:hypothetical protein H257_15715 [Aphanomyces astaci]ETV68256.1 hypothetical protein H257_15715 [Aphanomyces astaci]|eukprot:XP_009842199.1 hypothetical protein H257_15715 [Aphanomyces astaci]
MTTAAVASSSVEEGSCLPSRYQCPLCLDLLSSPVQLPCCRKHLCLACFERAVALTSANCAFCRKRIVSFARRQSKKIDDIFWTEIQSMTEGMDISTLTFESDDIDSRSRPVNSAAPGELHTYYEQCKAEREHERHLREQDQLAATLRFLEAESPSSARPPRPEQQQQPPPATTMPPVYSIFASAASASIHRASKGPVKKKKKKQPATFKRITSPNITLALKSKQPVKNRWSCASCTYVNAATQAPVCAMCHTKRLME